MTLKKLGGLALEYIFESARFGRANVIEDVQATWFGSFDTKQSQHESGDGKAGQIFYVWGPALGLRKLDMSQWGSFGDAIGAIIGEFEQLPTHLVQHNWSRRVDGGHAWNICYVYRFSDPEDQHLRKILDLVSPEHSE